MSKRFAVIDPATGIIENVIKANDGFTIPGKLLVEDPDFEAQIGGRWEDGVFYPAPEPEPEPEE